MTFKVNAPRVVHETLDDETIVIDTQSGFYYTARGAASAIWKAISEGQSPELIRAAYQRKGRQLPQAVLDGYVQQLSNANLIIPAETLTSGSAWNAPVHGSDQIETLDFECHEDMQGLIELDPIHEIDASQGWPFQTDETNR